MFIFAVVLAIIALTLLALGRATNRRAQTRSALAITSAVVGGTALLLFVFSLFYRVDVGEAAVVRSIDGTVTRSDATAGFSAKAPWEDVVTFDIRNQTITFETDGNGEVDGGSINLNEISAQTSDNATARFDVSVRYSIDPQAVERIYTEYRTQENLLDRLILPNMRSTLREAPTAYPADELRQQRSQVAAAMFEQLSESLRDNGILIDDVDLRDIRYTESIEESLSQIQTARARVEQARADLETSLIDAERVKTEAQAQSDADQIIRCGATSTTDVREIGGRDQEVTVVTPLPNEQCQNRLNEQVLTSRYIDMLRSAGAAGNTFYVIPPGTSTLLQLPAAPVAGSQVEATPPAEATATPVE